jgi:hypothetical protein
MFGSKFVDKIKTHILRSITFFPRRSCRLWINVKKYSTAKQATVHKITRRIRTACWVTNTIDTHNQNVKHLLLFHINNGYANVSQCTLYVHCLCCYLYSSQSLVTSNQNISHSICSGILHWTFNLQTKQLYCPVKSGTNHIATHCNILAERNPQAVESYVLRTKAYSE